MRVFNQELVNPFSWRSRTLCYRPNKMLLLSLIGGGLLLYGFSYIIALLAFDCDLQLVFYEKFGKSPRKLKGKVVFITGASSGIGEEIAKYLAKFGVKLVLTARRKDELERVKASCLVASHGQLTENDILVIQMDVTDLSSHQQHFDNAVHHFGGVDLLINNAGRVQRAVWENIEMAVDKQLFDLNVFGVVNLSRVAVNYFNTRGVGHIAVVSSIAGVVGAPYSATYTASKHAIHGYFNALRTEKLDQSITVTLLCPGPTFTNFLQESFTAKEGQKYGIVAQKSSSRMTAERCAELCSVAITNRLNEAWMGVFPIMPVTYCTVYCPILTNLLLKWIGVAKLAKLRDTKEGPVLSKTDRND